MRIRVSRRERSVHTRTCRSCSITKNVFTHSLFENRTPDEISLVTLSQVNDSRLIMKTLVEFPSMYKVTLVSTTVLIFPQMVIWTLLISPKCTTTQMDAL